MRLLSLEIPAGAPLPKNLARYLEGPLGLSGTLIKRLKMQGGLRLNGEVVRADAAPKPGDRLELVWSPPVPDLAPEPGVPVAIAYEDDAVWVLEKPPGLVVHPTKGVFGGTLLNGLAALNAGLPEPCGIHPIHRLDADTSGLLVVGKHPLAHERLARQLAARTLVRRYRAFVHGAGLPEEGLIKAPIARDEHHPVARRTASDGAAAQTRYRVVRRFAAPDVAEIELTLGSGRTHQIRVHLASIGHPLVGDALYGGGPLLPRHALHAASLDFAHPVTGEAIALRSPLPGDLAGAVAGWVALQSSAG